MKNARNEEQGQSTQIFLFFSGMSIGDCPKRSPKLGNPLLLLEWDCSNSINEIEALNEMGRS